jgi:hypothetical protein
MWYRGFLLRVEAVVGREDSHSGLNLNIQIQKLVFKFNSIQTPTIQYSGFIQDVISWQVLAEVNVSEVTGLSTVYSLRIHSPAGASRLSSLELSESYPLPIWQA